MSKFKVGDEVLVKGKITSEYGEPNGIIVYGVNEEDLYGGGTFGEEDLTPSSIDQIKGRLEQISELHKRENERIAHGGISFRPDLKPPSVREFGKWVLSLLEGERNE